MPEHLAEGSSEPILASEKLRLYGMRFCPFDHRVHLVLLAKNIPHDNVFINLKSKPDWFLKRVPSGKVPGLLVDGEVLYESLIIADFLDEKYPEKSLHSKDPLQKAKDRILIENFSKVSSLYYKFILNLSNPSSETFEAFVTELTAFDEELALRGSKFFSGNEPGMVDYMIWPFYERFVSIPILCGDHFKLPEAKLKHLVSWAELMQKDEAVKEYILRPETHTEFMKSHIAGNPDYNMSI